MCLPKNYQNTRWFDKIIAKIKRVQFFAPHCTLNLNEIKFTHSSRASQIDRRTDRQNNDLTLLYCFKNETVKAVYLVAS